LTDAFKRLNILFSTVALRTSPFAKVIGTVFTALIVSGTNVAVAITPKRKYFVFCESFMLDVFQKSQFEVFIPTS
jgi:hypothetical protein